MKKIIIFMCSFFFAVTTYGCSFGPGADLFKTPEENYPNYSHVVSGTIIDKQENNNDPGATYTFEIARTHKGNYAGTKTKLVSPGHSCGFFGSVGQHMLLFSNDLSQIDESSPRVDYDTVTQATVAGRSLEPIVQRGCTKEYQPVCAEVSVQCIQAPCPPIAETFSNRCLAEDRGAGILYEGQCKQAAVASTQKPPVTKPQVVDNSTSAATSITVTGPTAPPTEGFVGPTSPPPYDNSPQEEGEYEYSLVEQWWKRFTDWISALFAWI